MYQLICYTQSWARREYLAREQAIENGEEVEFGKWYQKSAAYDSNEVDQIPKLQE